MPTDEYSHREMQRYLSKLSGPLIDRVDIHVEVARIAYKELTGLPNGTDSETLRTHVIRAREIQTTRNGGPLKSNATLTGRELDRFAQFDGDSQSLLEAAMNELNLTPAPTTRSAASHARLRMSKATQM